MHVFLIKAAQLLLSLSILVVLHEMGHFIPAKLFKTRVEKFYLFFDVPFALFKKKIGETTYGIGWLPLGGYVKISGMVDESMDMEQMAEPPKPWEFRSKPAWQRLIIMIGGVTVNLLLGFFIYIMILFVWGRNYQEVQDIKYGYSVSKTLEHYGFENGDRIVSIDGVPFSELDDVNTYLKFRSAKNVEVKSPDGSVKILKIPKDIGKQLFEAGDVRPLTPQLPFKINAIIPNTPAAQAGLLASDRILSIDGNAIHFFSDLTNALKDHQKAAVLLTVKRDTLVKTLTVTPLKNNTIGIAIAFTDLTPIKYRHKSYTLAASITKGLSIGCWTIKDYLSQLKYLFTKKGASHIGGFATIGKMFPPAWQWVAFWQLTAFLSIMLGILNLLPIPALDGGHVMFLLYEIALQKKPSITFMKYAQIIGFVILITLVLYANGNDLFRAIFH